MSDFKVRLHGETADLMDRIEKLEGFILSEKYDALPEIDRADLKEQLGHMKPYLAVLMRRVSRLCS